ncbi:MAG: DoxX family protein [Myxococcaceae bacterium]
MNAPTTTRPTGGLHIGLWVAQVLLAVAFGMSGAMKLVTPIDQLAEKMTWIASTGPLVRFIGLSEVAGALGMLLPSALRIKPVLTPVAALGFVVIMVLAGGVHASRGEFGVIGANVVLGGLAAFVAFGRLKKAPIPPK